MTGPETGGDVAVREFWESIWSAAKPELYPGSIFQFAQFAKNYLPKAGRLRDVPGKILHRSAWLSQQSVEGPGIRLGKRMMVFRKFARWR